MISKIAHWDWPEQWPNLFGLLMQCVLSGNPDSVDGAMRVIEGVCYRALLGGSSKNRDTLWQVMAIMWC